VQLSASIWLSILAGVAVVLSVARLTYTKIRNSRLELGSVSTQWIVEHRSDSDIPSR